MAKHKPKRSGADAPKVIAASNFATAVDQLGEYESLAYLLAVYRVNTGDTIVEYYDKGNVRALHEGLRSYDRQVKKLWQELKRAVGLAEDFGRTPATQVLHAWVELQKDDYYTKQLSRSGPSRGRFSEIETEANPRRKATKKRSSKKATKKPTRKKNPVSVRKLVNEAMK